MDKYTLVLQTQNKDYHALYQLLQEQNKLLIASEQTSLAVLNKQVELLFLKVSRQEKMLDVLQGQSGEQPVLEAKLNEQRQQLQSIIKANRALLQNKMQFIDFNINIMTCSTTGNSYGQGGSDKTDTKLKIFDQSV